MVVAVVESQCMDCPPEQKEVAVAKRPGGGGTSL